MIYKNLFKNIEKKLSKSLFNDDTVVSPKGKFVLHINDLETEVEFYRVKIDKKYFDAITEGIDGVTKIEMYPYIQDREQIYALLANAMSKYNDTLTEFEWHYYVDTKLSLLDNPFGESPKFSSFDFSHCYQLDGTSFGPSTTLTSVNLSETYISFVDNLFSNCTNLVIDAANINNPWIFENYKRIGDNCFSNTKVYGKLSLTSDNTKYDIGNEAFLGCTGLTEVAINGDVGANAFFGCTGVKKLTISQYRYETPVIDMFAFSSMQLDDLYIKTGNGRYLKETSFSPFGYQNNCTVHLPTRFQDDTSVQNFWLSELGNDITFVFED